jgi:stalled ribosome rescue protein Dom34
MNKKQKLAFDAAKKRKLFVLRMVVLQQREAHEIAIAADYAMIEQQREKSKTELKRDGDDDQPWTARTQMIRNRLTNQRRQSNDRWNRFAGTDAAGAMGR